MEYLIILLIVVGLYLVVNCKKKFCANDSHADDSLDGGEFGNKVDLPRVVKRKTRKRTDKAVKKKRTTTRRKVVKKKKSKK